MQELFNLDGEIVATSNGKWLTVGQTKVFHWYCESRKHTYVDPQLAYSCCKNELDEPAAGYEIDPKHREERILDKNWFEVALFRNCDIE
ncbi:MAG: hypothetical protein AB8G05_24920 [Oligoflexales bacterium]